jgi:RNA polymerase sigma-70 factor (ECF subfamily)
MTPLVSTVCVTDAELVAQARAGDRAAFGELVDRHRSAVFRAALAALGTYAEAEDAAQDACVAAWRRIASFRGEASFRTWLLTIVWRQALNRRRGAFRWWRRTVSMDASDGTEPFPTIESTGPSPEQLATRAELRRDIRSAIRTLTPTLRDTFLLAQSGEHSYEEIGAMLGAPVGTIKWRVAEARRLVKHKLRARGHVEQR